MDKYFIISLSKLNYMHILDHSMDSDLMIIYIFYSV
jgi:hypothetical protein